MPFDLSNLAALGSGIPGGFQRGQMNQQQIIGQQLQNQAAQQKIRQQQVEDQANIAAGLGLIDDTSQYQPPAAPPQQQQQQQQPSMGGGPMPASPVGRPMVGGPPSAGGPAPGPMQAGGGGAPQPQPQPQAPQMQPSAAPRGNNPLDPYSIAARIKKANPGIKPDALFKATSQTITMMGPLAQNQYRQDILDLRTQLQTQSLEERMREADQKIAQGADKIAVQQEALNIRQQIAQMQQQNVNTRQTDRLNASLDALLVKAGVAPSGDVDKDRAAAAGANAAKAGVATASKALDKQIGDAQKDYDNTLKDNNELLRANGGFPPKEGTAERARYDGNIRSREGLKGKIAGLKDQRSKAAAAPSPAAAPSAGAGGTKDSPAKPTTQAEYDALPSGAYFQDDEGVKQKP